MADEIIVLDAAGSNVDGSNPGSPLSIGPGTSYGLLEGTAFPAAPLNVMYASSVDTEGEIPVSRRYGNRAVTLHVEMAESGAVNTLLDALQAKFAKFQREGGTIHRTRKDGTVRIYDVVAGDGWDPLYDFKYILGHVAEVTMTLPALPLARGTEQDLGDNTETSLPCLIFSETVSGDDTALGRLVVDDDQAVDQQWLIWGVETNAQYTHTTSSGSGALFYEAESRTAQGGSATAVGPTGASGAGSNVMRNTSLSTSYQAILSTQATGGGAHLSHVGQFAIYVRAQVPTTNTGTVTVALEWAQGDFLNYTLNASQTIQPSWEGSWRILPLGLVNIDKVPTGTQRWEGRIVAKSTVAGDDIDVDWIMLVPVDYGSGEASSLLRLASPTSFSARDEFDQTSGTLGGKTLPVGGTWSASGSATGATVNSTLHMAARSTAPGGEGDHFERAGTGTWTDVAVQADVVGDPAGALAPLNHGVFARYTNTSNYLRLTLVSSGPGSLRLAKVVAGSATTLMDVNLGTVAAAARLAGESFRLILTVSSAGRWVAFLDGDYVDTGIDTDLATGGTLASGGAGIFENTSGALATTQTRYDNFAVWVPSRDATVFASQSLEVRHDRVIRENSSGGVWQRPASYLGDYLRVPPSGAEARSIRAIVKMSRSVPGYGPDSGTDDLSAKLFAIYRYL
jgi:hypothetical protein